MKRLAMVLLLLLAAGTANADWFPLIGMYGNEAGLTCELDVTQFSTATVYLMAVLRTDMPGMTACEFRIENLPTPDMAITTFNWNTPLVIGNPGYGIALAFSPPLYGRVHALGSIEFFPLVDFPDDWRMRIEPSSSSGQLLIVDLEYAEVETFGDLITLNCTGILENGCDCLVPWWVTAAQESSWGQIKALY